MSIKLPLPSACVNYTVAVYANFFYLLFTEHYDLIVEMDEDTEGMQSTILFLQDQLRASKEQLNQHSSYKANNNSNPLVANVVAATVGQSSISSPSSASPASLPGGGRSVSPITQSQQLEGTTITGGGEGRRIDASNESNNSCMHVAEAALIDTGEDSKDTSTTAPDNNNIPESDILPTSTDEVQCSFSAVPEATAAECVNEKEAVSNINKSKEEMQASVESMIIPHDKLSYSTTDGTREIVADEPVALDDNNDTDSHISEKDEQFNSNGRKRTRNSGLRVEADGDEAANDDSEGMVEPLCKRTKATVLGTEEQQCQPRQPILENGLEDS